MQSLLNLLMNLTEEERREMSHELHVIEQVTLAQNIYPGAPMAALEDRQRVAEVLGNYLLLLNHQLTREASSISGEGK